MRNVFSIFASGLAFSLLCSVPLVAATAPAQAQQTSSINRGPSGLPLPRFVSLKAARVNMRVGPGKEYAVNWMFNKQGMPLEIIQEYDNWRRVRDADGATGWIYGSLLSGNRTALTAPWKKESGDGEPITLYKAPKANADAVAYLEPGVVVNLKSCDGAWCAMEVASDSRVLKGYASQADLWGAYPDETIEE